MIWRSLSPSALLRPFAYIEREEGGAQCWTWRFASPRRSPNGFLIYVSRQLARNFWDHGKASVFFTSNTRK